MPNVKIGVKVYFNQNEETLEVLLTNQVKRQFIGPIDSIVTQIVGETPLRRKFCKESSGEFLGEETIQIPLYGLWTVIDKKRSQVQNRGFVVQRTSPTSLGENAKITKFN